MDLTVRATAQIQQETSKGSLVRTWWTSGADVEQQQQAQVGQLRDRQSELVSCETTAMAQQMQNQIQCALHQQQQARISDLEAERAATAQQVEVQVQTALIEHQHQQQTQVAQLVEEQMHLCTEQLLTKKRQVDRRKS